MNDSSHVLGAGANTHYAAMCQRNAYGGDGHVTMQMLAKFFWFFFVSFRKSSL